MPAVPKISKLEVHRTDNWLIAHRGNQQIRVEPLAATHGGNWFFPMLVNIAEAQIAEARRYTGFSVV